MKKSGRLCYGLEMKKIFFVGAILIAIFIFYQSYISWFKTDSFKVFFFDVGQGDSALIIAPGGKTILIDGGPDDKVLRHLGEALPFWQRKIDLLVITHAHDDHIAGLISISRRYEVKQVLYNNLNLKTPTLETLTNIFKTKRLNMTAAHDGMIFNFGNHCSLDVLSASREISLDENDYSIVTLFDCLNKKILLTGDAGKYIEDYLLSKNNNLKSDILKISHHGSTSANSENFLTAVNPQLGVISVGQDNKFNHPNLTILERLEKMAVDIYRTDKQGTIIFLANNKTINLLK